MHIEFVEIQNFRKLKAIRIDFSPETSVFVGSNNSGKTSAMNALGHFLIDSNRFHTNDLTLSNWKGINKIGREWEKLPQTEQPAIDEWIPFLPTMDIWLNVDVSEIHHVRNIIPSLDWDGGKLGVRLRFEPKKVDEFFREYIQARKSSNETVAAAKSKKAETNYTLSLWPGHMGEFLSRRFKSLFTIRTYLLDPDKIAQPKNGNAIPQIIDPEQDFIEGNPLNGLIRIDEINAQRGFSNTNSGDDADTGGKRKLSDQLRGYFSKHIDPSEVPEPSDVDALQAIHEAQSIFDEKLKSSFEVAFTEIAGLGYPGLNDLELILSTKIHPMDGLNHDAALQYRVNTDSSDSHNPCLPEHYNGLGYQNLISMVFRLMSFRDQWMRVGKANKKLSENDEDQGHIPPLHIVLVEEPEAHLHVQVQQVFIRKAYEILRRHDDLGDKKDLTTQLIVTTHSSHIAHECEFSWLRYFRRRPALIRGDVPTTTVVNLSEVFGQGTETQKFVARYLKTTHCDLFFADAAILVEGPAERILVPHFIRHHFKELHQSYVSILEISGSHAHTLRPLVEHLGLITLVITDIDAADLNAQKKLVSTVPKRASNQVSGNFTVRKWCPSKKTIDDLLDLSFDEKVIELDKFSSVRVCYQTPIRFNDVDGTEVELIPNTFEDAFFYENHQNFSQLQGKTGFLKKLKSIKTDNIPYVDYGENLFELLKTADKAQFALDILYQDVNKLKIPTYISEGLNWIQRSLKTKLLDSLIEEVAVIEAVEPELIAASEPTEVAVEELKSKEE